MLYDNTKTELITLQGNLIAALGISIGAGLAGLMLYVIQGRELIKQVRTWSPMTVLWVCAIVFAIVVTIGILLQFACLHATHLRFYLFQVEVIINAEAYGLEQNTFLNKASTGVLTRLFNYLFAPKLFDTHILATPLNIGIPHLLLTSLLGSFSIFGILRAKVNQMGSAKWKNKRDSEAGRLRKRHLWLAYISALCVFVVLFMVFSGMARLYFFPLLPAFREKLHTESLDVGKISQNKRFVSVQ